MVSAFFNRNQTEPRAAGAPESKRRSCCTVMVLSIWCGLLAGLLEVGIICFRKRFVDLNQFYWMSRHFPWLIPATDLLIFATVGILLSTLILCRRAVGISVSSITLSSLTLLVIVWTSVPEIHGVAGFVLAAGMATRLVPLLNRLATAVRRLVKFSLPFLALVLLSLSVWDVAGDHLSRQRAETRPLPPAGAPNVLLIVLDTVAAEHLSLHGYARPTSPSIEQLARQGVRFDRVQATASWTLPSHATMFTGRWPHELSAGWLTPLDESYPTLAEYLTSRGYDTAGFVANMFYCATDSGLARGFGQYRDYTYRDLSAFKMATLVKRPLEGLRAIDDFLRSHLNTMFFQGLLWKFDASNRKYATEINQEFLDWTDHRRHPERPFFAFLNYFDAHFPYRLPERGIHRFGVRPRTEKEINLIDHWRTLDKRELSLEEIAFARNSYDDCIAVLDEQIGKLTDELTRRGVLDRTWLIITSDHGESFGEHHHVFGHGTSLYQTQLHVPLVIVSPARSTSPEIVSETVSLRDLPATIVDILHLEKGSPFPGQSLANSWSPRSRANPLAFSPALSELALTDLLNPDLARSLEERQIWASLARDDWIYIRREGNVQEELYDARTDRAELDNRAQLPTMKSVVDRARGLLDKTTGGPLTRNRFNP